MTKIRVTTQTSFLTEIFGDLVETSQTPQDDLDRISLLKSQLV